MSQAGGFLLTYRELEALDYSSALAFRLYVILRSWMDFSTGVVGRSRPLSRGLLGAWSEHHVPRGSGAEPTRPSVQQIRTALEALKRAGLLQQHGDQMVFSMPLAHRGQGASKSNPTEWQPGGHSVATPVEFTPETRAVIDIRSVRLSARKGRTQPGISSEPNLHQRYQENLETSPDGEVLSGKPDAAGQRDEAKAARTRELRAQAVEVLAYLNDCAKTAYRPVPANIDLIVARLREGYSVRDLRVIVYCKCDEWGEDDKMRAYLRPATLFNRTNCAQYHGQHCAPQETAG